MTTRSPHLAAAALVIASAVPGCFGHTAVRAESESSGQELLRAKGGPSLAAHEETARVAGEAFPDTVESPRTDRVLLPYLFYAPETGLGGGVVAAGYRRLRPELPASSLLANASVTVRRQFTVEGSTDLYLPDGSRIDGSVRFQHFPDRFFGIGPATPDEAEEAYTLRMARLEARLQRRIRPGIRAGPQATLRWEDVVETEEGGVLEDGTLPGSEGGTWLGLGGLATRDTRDDVVSPRRGGYVEASALFFPGAVATTGYRTAALDLRRFLPLGEGSVVGARGRLDVAGGEVPVLALPALGGNQRLRGYYEGRLRDRTAVSGQAEVRFPLRGRFGGVAFAEAGQVGPRVGDLASGRPELSGGLGLRYRITREGAPIRVDYGLGRRGGGLYLTLGEAF